MPQVNPKVLAWARETAGLTRNEAARKLNLGGVRGVGPGDRLKALETGADQPTRSVLARMAKQYRRPLIAFYLEKPPRASPVGTDFRTLGGEISARQDALVRALVRDVIARQGIVRDQLEDDDAGEARFVGTVSMADGRPAALRALQQVVGSALDPGGARPDFGGWREAVERAGVYVLLQGDLGSYHSALKTTAFRGFALADRLAPFIVVNSNDARAAWSFTLLHEAVHLLLGHTGISGEDAHSDVERFCNDVASECLLPSSAIDEFVVPGDGRDQLVDSLSRLSARWRVSRSLVAYRLYRAEKIDRTLYNRLSEAFRRQWNEERERRGASGGGPNYYAVKRHRIGKPLLMLVERGVGEGSLPTTKAAVVLGVKPTQVGQMLGMQASA